MGKQRFAKGSDEFMMFTDFWKLCQDYWTPEEPEEWWQQWDDDMKAFAHKYGMTPFVRGLCMALSNHLEELNKGKGDKK